jgi:thiol-disulfide isomerase/thioredoxin
MSRLAIILTFCTTVIYGQTSTKYDWNHVIKYVKRNKMSATKGTQEIVSEITRAYSGEDQQIELIRFYKEAYNYKIVDKSILKGLADSLTIYGKSEKVKSFAAESIKSVEYRLLNKKIKDFEFSDKDGQLVKLTDLREKIVIIELWATWCGPCIKEMSKISELRKQNPNIEFYSISVDKSPDKMKKFIEKTKYDWPIVFGGDQEVNTELWEYLSIVAIPQYYTVDRQGIVINVSDKLDEQYINSLK